MTSANTLEELEEKLKTYQEELAAVQELLDEDPKNGELKSLLSDLEGFIKLTQDLCDSKRRIKAQKTGGAGKLATPAEFTLGVGVECEAKFGDGKWYNARIESKERDPISGEDKFSVKFIGSGTVVRLPSESLRAKGSEVKKEAVKGRKRPGDYKERIERKKIVAETIRLRNEAQKETRANWMNFQTKASKKGRRFVKHESIFKPPDGIKGKIGVTGSGKPLTHYQEFGKVAKTTITTPEEITPKY